MPRISDYSYEIHTPVDEVELPQPQSSSTRATPQPQLVATTQTPRALHLNQAEIDRILASYGRVTTTDVRRYTPPTQQTLDFDPDNLTISERVGLNDMGIHRPRYYKRTGEKL